MSVTLEGPIRVRRRNSPNNDGSIAPDDTGAVICSRDTTITFPQAGNISIANLPAGSAIQNIRIWSTSTATPAGGNINIAFTPVGGSLTNIGTITFATPTANTTTLYQIGTNIAPTFAQTATWQNTGTMDGTLSVSTGLPTGVVWYVTVTYTVRNADGSILPYGAGLTNDGTNSPRF